MIYRSSQPIHEWVGVLVLAFTLGMCIGPVGWFWFKKGIARIWRAVTPYVRHGLNIGGSDEGSK